MTVDESGSPTGPTGGAVTGGALADSALASATPTFVDVPPATPAPGNGTDATPTAHGGTPGAGLAAGFRLAVVPTTVQQYWYYLVDQGLDRAPAPLLHGFPMAAGTGLRTGQAGAVEIDPELGELPVTWVTWHGATAYCAWLTARVGVPCRLPSAAEWRHAAAGPAGFRWALGDDFDRPVYAPTATGPWPAGRTPANGFGLYDMTGNVFEWCQDPLAGAGATPWGAVDATPWGTVDATADTAPGAAANTTAGGAESLPGSRIIKGGAYTVRNPESFDNATIFTADELSAVPYIGFRVLSAGVPAGAPARSS